MAPDYKEACALLAQLVLEHGTANDDWTVATVRVPAQAIHPYAPMAVWTFDPVKYEYVVTAPIPQEPHPEKKPVPTKRKVTNICKNCGTPIFRFNPINGGPVKTHWKHDDGRGPCKGWNTLIEPRDPEND